MSDSLAPIVIDNGSGVIKAGLAWDIEPKAIVPAVVGNPRFVNRAAGATTVVGDAALKGRAGLTLMVRVTWSSW